MPMDIYCNIYGCGMRKLPHHSSRFLVLLRTEVCILKLCSKSALFFLSRICRPSLKSWKSTGNPWKPEQTNQRSAVDEICKCIQAFIIHPHGSAFSCCAFHLQRALSAIFPKRAQYKRRTRQKLGSFTLLDCVCICLCLFLKMGI